MHEGHEHGHKTTASHGHGMEEPTHRKAERTGILDTVVAMFINSVVIEINCRQGCYVYLFFYLTSNINGIDYFRPSQVSWTHARDPWDRKAYRRYLNGGSIFFFRVHFHLEVQPGQPFYLSSYSLQRISLVFLDSTFISIGVQLTKIETVSGHHWKGSQPIREAKHLRRQSDNQSSCCKTH